MSYSMSDLLQLVVSEGASDLHIRVGVAPTIRVHGILHRVEGPFLRAEDTEELTRSITSDDNIQQVRERGGVDFGFAFAELGRFRVSGFKEKGNFGGVLRRILTARTRRAAPGGGWIPRGASLFTGGAGPLPAPPPGPLRARTTPPQVPPPPGVPGEPGFLPLRRPAPLAGPLQRRQTPRAVHDLELGASGSHHG